MLTRLLVTNLRNIVQASLAFSPQLNLIVGKNGSGKTSLLEAIHYLATARSFRSHQITPLVTHGENESVVFGQIVGDSGREIRAGVRRSLAGKREIRIDGEPISKASELARLLPVLVLGPETVDLLLGSPQLRRKFLNWGVFHVKPFFSDEWDIANRCLKQRNKLLKGGHPKQELKVWTDKLVQAAETIDGYRQAYFDKYVVELQQLVGELTEFGSKIHCEYSRGWDRTSSLASVFEQSLEGDIRRGFSQFGFHKADIKLKINGQPVTEVCSRGELKMLAWAMVLTQGKIQQQINNQSVLYLVDDLVSELDLDHRRLLCQNLLKMKAQVMATGINEKELEASWNECQAEVFHVKQGVLSALSSTRE